MKSTNGILPRKEGYWHDGKYKWGGTPVHSDKKWSGKAEFIEKLNKLEAQLTPTLYRGISICRCCGQRNGSGEYSYGGFEWPTGFKHYIVEHNVKPTPAFRQMVMET